MSKIHPTAIIDGDVTIAEGVEIGPYCLIQGKVKIGAGTIVEAHATVGCRSSVVTLGEKNHIAPGAVIGGPPQDISYKGEPTELIIGNGNTFREFSTVNIATTKGDRKTVIGNNCYLMAYTHVGHDCLVGNHVIMANNSMLGGHCEIGDNVVISGMCGIIQFIRIGKGAFVAGASTVNKDVLPFARAEGNWASIRATNKIGMLRRGMTKDEVQNIHKAIRIMTMGSATIEEGLQRIQSECTASENIDFMVKFIRSSKKGIALSRSVSSGHKGNSESSASTEDGE